MGVFLIPLFKQTISRIRGDKFFFLFSLHHAVSADQSKHASRLVCGRDGIPEKIPVNSSNMRYDHGITHLEV